MKFLIVLTFAAVAYAGMVPVPQTIDNYAIDTLENGDGEIDLIYNREQGAIEVAPRFVISWQVRRFIRKLQKQMPCGFPSYGIPPLAPLKLSEGQIHLQKGILETFDEIFRFRVDGLDAFEIKKFKLNVITSKITFDFRFKTISATATKYQTDTILDAMNQLGISVQYEGDGALDFGLYNFRLSGVLKYKIPILWGSAKITSLKTKVSLEKCDSNISGLIGDGAINRMINRQIENVVEQGINGNQDEISDLIESTLVPKVNAMLKGNDFWTLVDYIFSSSEGEKEDDPIVVDCVAPTDPWA